MSVTSPFRCGAGRFRFGAGAILVAAALLTGCAGSKAEVIKAGQTGTPLATTTTVATTTTSTVPGDSGVAEADTGPADGVKAVDGQAPAERTIAIIGGSFQPSTLTVQVGDTVTFKGKGNVAYQLVVGSVEPYTVTAGLVQTYRFSKPGTITVSQDESQDTATITVEGTAAAATDSTTTTAAPSADGAGDGSATTVVATGTGVATTEPALTPTSVGPGSSGG